MAKRKKRPSLENYLSTGKVHWEGGSSLIKESAATPGEESLPAETVVRESLSEKELLFLSMLEDGEKSHWEFRFRRGEVLFSSLQVMEERQAFADGERGEFFKLRRRKSSLEKIEEEKDIAFPLLALVEVVGNTLYVRCNHVK